VTTAKTKTATKAATKKAAPSSEKPGKVAFPKKRQPPTDGEFAARLPAAAGRRFEALRAFLGKQGAREELYYYGPRTGWAYRYLGAHDDRSLCALVILEEGLVAIVGLDAAAQERLRWDELSDVARRARRMAHGTPSLLWLDVPLDGTGASDVKAMLKAKLAGAKAGAKPTEKPGEKPGASGGARG
jgi:hypothetical protein